MTANFKKLPLDKKVIEQMKVSTPDLYSDMVGKYGEENVVNNLLVTFVILTEEKQAAIAKGGKPILVTKELIDRAESYNNSAFQKYVTEPINKLKSWVVAGDSSLGYTPIKLNHEDVYDRQGYIVGGSYKKVSIDGIWHLLAEGVLINPEAKMKWLQGLYREVSPTINEDSGKITELSFVNIPAQMTNTSMSAGDETKITVVTPSVCDEWAAKIEQAKLQAEIEKQQLKIKQKEDTATYYTNKLLKQGVIKSSQRRRVQEVFVQLASGEESMIAGILSDIGTSPLNHKPRNVFLKGTLDMSITRTERWLKFESDNKGKYSSEADLKAAFEKHEAQSTVSLSDGSGTIGDPMEDILDKLEALKKSGALTDDNMKKLAAYCGTTAQMSESGNVGSGEPTDAGTEIGIPNNTSLSNGEGAPAGQAHMEMLEKGFNAAKAEAEAYKAEAEELRAQVDKIKQQLGV